MLRHLLGAIRDSSRVRTEAGSALDSIARDFNRDFSPAEHPHRRPARSLVIKASNVISRLQAIGRALEQGASACAKVAQRGAQERDAAVVTLRGEIDWIDAEARRECGAMAAAMARTAEAAEAEKSATKAALSQLIADAEAETAAAEARIEELERELEAAGGEARRRDGELAAARGVGAAGGVARGGAPRRRRGRDGGGAAARGARGGAGGAQGRQGGGAGGGRPPRRGER